MDIRTILLGWGAVGLAFLTLSWVGTFDTHAARMAMREAARVTARTIGEGR